MPAAAATPPPPDPWLALRQALEQSINIPPTLNKNHGELVNIFVARDVDFSSVYQLRRIESRTQILDRTVPGVIVAPAIVTK